MQERNYLSSLRIRSIIVVLTIGAFLVLFLLGFHWYSSMQDAGFSVKAIHSVFRHSYISSDGNAHSRGLQIPLPRNGQRFSHDHPPKFDFERCSDGFKVHVYPLEEESRFSSSYLSLVNTLRSSKYYTSNPNFACIFVLAIDTLDRDVLSANYVRNLESKIHKLTYWNNGINHLIFTLFTGTWPEYLEEMGFDYGSAMIARASISDVKIRYGFDISFPLFDKLTPPRDEGLLNGVQLFPAKRRIFAGFKGKRYLAGVGSDTRNALHVLHNGKDFILLTTCKHGKGWQKIKDDRCDADNMNYDRFDYQDLLQNATFCLVPRGRRLGSFRFAEALRAGCIPVVLSNGWELPFSEVIDWKRAIIQIDERSLLHLSVILWSYSNEEILHLRQQGLFLWQTYFASIEKITMTTLELLKDRIFPNQRRSFLTWNLPPGVLSVNSEFSRKVGDFPFFFTYTESHRMEKFTAMILATSPVRFASSSLFRLILSINQSQYVDQGYSRNNEPAVEEIPNLCITLETVTSFTNLLVVFSLEHGFTDVCMFPKKKILVIWLPIVKIPGKDLWPKTKVALRVIYPGKKSLNSRFLDSDLIATDAVFSFNEDVVISQDEIDFAFKTWKSFPDRIVGFTSRTHYWDYSKSSWTFSSKKINSFSMVMPNAAVYHRYFNHLYTNHLPSEMEEMVNQLVNCEGIAFNFLISKVTKKRPILLCSSHHFHGGSCNKERLGVRISQEEYYKQEKSCFTEFTRIMKTLPLQRSYVKIDPLLYKDAVSNFRKRYRLFEL